MGKYFGTDGFRGEANVNLTVEHAYKVGRFLGWYFGREHKAQIVIGKDTRRSSYMFEYSLVAGLTASGADAFLLHVTTTPSVAYVVRTDQCRLTACVLFDLAVRFLDFGFDLFQTDLFEIGMCVGMVAQFTAHLQLLFQQISGFAVDILPYDHKRSSGIIFFQCT